MREKEFQRLIGEWAQTNLRNFPWRKKCVSPYEIFVAEMLLKRTTAKAAASIYKEVLKEFPSIKKLAVAEKEKLHRILMPIGYPKRAEQMIKAAEFIVTNYKKFPKDKQALMEIPFVGDYTSSAILSVAYGIPYPMVDSNVNRIITRVFLGINPPTHITNRVRHIAEEVLSKRIHRKFNFAMLDLGGTVCNTKYPKCNMCPLAKICKFNKTKSK